MNDLITSYLKGREEGYFNARLGFDILNHNQQSRAFFAKGYQIGKTTRRIEEINETEASINNYIESRKVYITIIGYKSSYEDNCFANSQMLREEEDKRAFERGSNIGLACKNNNLSELNEDDLRIYAAIVGYNNAMNDVPNYSFIIREEDRYEFQKGYNVGQICKDIKRDAIEELNATQIKYIENKAKKNRFIE